MDYAQQCMFKLCYFYDPPIVTASELKKIKRVPCIYCDDLMYCSERCREKDWLKYHKEICINNPENILKQDTSEEESDEIDDISFNSLEQEKALEHFVIVTQDIGHGSYGRVDLVQDVQTGQRFAMKTISKANPTNPQFLMREVSIQKKLKHLNVLQLFYCFEDREYIRMVLEYADMGSLAEILLALKMNQKPPIVTSPVNEAQVFQYFKQICTGLHYLHCNHVIHRDLKPENILLSQNGMIKLCDFGWSAEVETSLSRRDTICGTMDYMGPEMIFSNQGYNYSVDIWSLGIILYELLNGSYPFKENKLKEYYDNPKRIQMKITGISQQAEDLVNQLLQIDPQKRCSLQNVIKHPWVSQNFSNVEGYESYCKEFEDITIKGPQSIMPYFLFSPSEEDKSKEPSESVRSSNISMGCIDDYFIQQGMQGNEKFNILTQQLDKCEKGILSSDQIQKQFTEQKQESIKISQEARLSLIQRHSKISRRNNLKQIDDRPIKKQEGNIESSFWKIFSCVKREKS